MPSALKRGRDNGGYGWSKVYGRENRTLSKEYMDGYDKIDWSKGRGKLGPPTGKNPYFRLGGCALVWHEECFNPDNYGSSDND